MLWDVRKAKMTEGVIYWRKLADGVPSELKLFSLENRSSSGREDG